MSGFWQDKTVLITGGTGSFGQAFAAHVLRGTIRKLVVFSRDEAKQESMAEAFPDERLRFLLGDVRDSESLHHALRGVDVVVHAAALKRVPALEYAPMECLKTNVLGAANVINAAIDNGVERVVALSTDKACHPHNVYGKSKALAESLFVNATSLSGPNGPTFSVVRYGNVANSRGSLIPRLQEQATSGVVTLTHHEMTRFWVTLDQAAKFVAERIPDGEGGEIFVPLLPSVRIVDVITAVAPECKVRTIGVRPGEKMHELLVTEDESTSTVRLGDRYVIWPSGRVEPGSVFAYSSRTNDRWLSVEEIREALCL